MFFAGVLGAGGTAAFGAAVDFAVDPTAGFGGAIFGSGSIPLAIESLYIENLGKDAAPSTVYSHEPSKNIPETSLSRHFHAPDNIAQERCRKQDPESPPKRL